MTVGRAGTERNSVMQTPNERTSSWTTLATRVLAPNPGPMTLDGTNTYVLRAAGSAGVVVVDPGPSDPEHRERILALGHVELVLVTHHHRDHTESAASFDAPVRAADPALCVDALPLRHDDQFEAAGVRIRVVATPGHTADSVCLLLPDDTAIDVPSAGGAGSMLTGDTILGRGTTVLDGAGGGTLGDYLRTLRALIDVGPAILLPGHGDRGDDLSVVARTYLTHREKRLAEVERAVARLVGAEPRHPVTVDAVTDLVYGDVPANVRGAAEASVAVQLAYLDGREA